MGFLLRLLPAACLLGMVGGALAAAPAELSPADQTAIHQVIQQQLDAFRHDDGAAAFAEASPGIRAQFGEDADSFMSMVRRAYQPVYRPRSTAFGTLINQGGQIVQTLEITGQGGGDHEALYFMEHEADGQWRISGCVLTNNHSVGA